MGAIDDALQIVVVWDFVVLAIYTVLDFAGWM